MIHRLKKFTVCSVLSVALPAMAALDPVPVPPENPITEGKRALGKILFWEQQLSSDDTVACGSCHRPGAGGADPRRALHPGPDQQFGSADDVVGSPGIAHLSSDNSPVFDPLFGFDPQVTGRTSPSFIGAMYAERLFWDGRAESQFRDPENSDQVLIAAGGALENQALGPILSSVEMAKEGRTWGDVTDKLQRLDPLILASDIPQDIAATLAQHSDYPALFANAFGDNRITPARIAMAIATYERTLVADQTPWDRYMAGDNNAMTADQIAGWQALRDRSACLTCHRPPLFSDNRFHNIGLRPSAEDLGREAISGRADDRGRFKTPSLRGVGLRGALMHVGWIEDSMDAIDFYNAGSGDVTSSHEQFSADQTGVPGRRGSVGNVVLAPGSERVQASVANFLDHGLTDPRVAGEIFPFDRPRLAGEEAEVSTGVDLQVGSEGNSEVDGELADQPRPPRPGRGPGGNGRPAGPAPRDPLAGFGSGL